TAYYGLVQLARLQPGEQVLIHSAATGTGLAALEIGQQLGAEVWATAGSEAKRDFLRERGCAHPMDSRVTDFAQTIAAATDHRGVDVVLNSLAGDGMRASLASVGQYGRFVELGKTDLWGQDWLRTEPFRRNLAYYTVDMAAMVADRPEVFGRLLRDVVRRLEDGTWRPLPVECVRPQGVREALHRLAAGRHVGKLVVSMDDRRETPVRRSKTIEATGTYLITGGLGGIGLYLAEWLAGHGARHLMLVGRRAPGAAADIAISRMRSGGADIRVHQADVSDEAQLAGIIAAIPTPLRGVIHAAAELADGAVEQLSEESIARAWRPKATGAWNLHAMTQTADLDFFVVMSSVASILGSPAQGNYAAASAWADALIGWRRKQGMPGLTINWGPWADVGLAAAQSVRGERLAERGMASLAADLGAAIFGQLLDTGAGQAIVMQLNLRQWQQYYPAAASSPLLRALELDAMGTPGEDVGLRRALVQADPKRRREILEERIRTEIARILRLAASEGGAPGDTSFASLGVDSLLAIEFRNRLELIFGVPLHSTVVWTHPTLAELVEHLAKELNLDLGAPLVVAEPDAAEARVGAMSDEMAEAELLTKLGPA
ncbi:MAG: SDR family NAD(P)-dependent oxidoreductase, partial [Chloroflexi bacterium]|nr:SDR family NAD(P)-dependent oxidoreductase [Chloroflexota bacterium]